MKQFMDIFSLPEMTLLSCVNEHFLKNNIDYEPVHLYKDVKVRAEGRASSGLWLCAFPEEASCVWVEGSSSPSLGSLVSE